MSENLNPYQAPAADLNAPKPTISGTGLTETMVKYLKEAAPWIRFIGVLSYIGCGFMLLGGVGFTIAIPFSFLGVAAASLPARFMGSSLGVIYIILGVIMFFPARFTYNFGAKIRGYLQSNSEQELEIAFKNNKSLWKFYGILCIIYLALIPVGIIVGIILAIGFNLF